MALADVIVVGAGVAGCAAAATALESGSRVTVFEAGSSGPLPEILRSPDLTVAAGVEDWWWPGPYPAGRGVGGGSAVNGMVLQRPAAGDPAVADLGADLDWAWSAFAPEQVEPGPLARRLAGSVGEQDGWRLESAFLAIRGGRRVTAADVWLTTDPRLTVVGGHEVTAGEIREWARHRTVLVAAGALGSPPLVGVEPQVPLDHRAVVVSFDVNEELRCTEPDRPAASVVLRAGDVQMLVLDHTGGRRDGGALIVMTMVEDPGGERLAAGVAAAHQILRGVGIEGRIEPGSAPVAHACCTLTGVLTPVPVVDASTLRGLPAVTPMLTVAAHARRATLEALGATARR